MVSFVGALPVCASFLTLFICLYIVIVLVSYSQRFYHLWNRLAVVLFVCLLIETIFRSSLQIYDETKEHRELSNTLCDVTYGVNSFLSNVIEALYVMFMLTLCVPAFNEPGSKKDIDVAAIPYLVVAFLWGTLSAALPLFMHTPLKHRHAWCWLDVNSVAMRSIFDYAPALISLLVAVGLVVWVLSTYTRVRKWRILTLAVTDAIVTAVFAVFSFVEAANPITAGSAAFDAFTVWIVIHDLVRAVAFIIAEKLYPNIYVSCVSTTSRRGAVTATGGGGDVGVGGVGDGGAGTAGAAAGAADEFTSGAAGGAAATGSRGAVAAGGQQNEATELVGDANDVDEVMEIGDDTLTYFVRHLQRNSAMQDDSVGDYGSRGGDDDSQYSGGRGVSLRHSSASSASPVILGYGTNNQVHMSQYDAA